MPTTCWVAKVPERMPRSWPPPCICGRRRMGGSRRTYRAPTPFGPYILCADRLMRSMAMACTSKGSLPALWAASTWKRTPAARQIWPMAATSLTTPISLFTCIRETSRVSSRSASATCSGRMMPSAGGTSQVTSKPWASKWAQVSSTALCSMALVMMWRRDAPSARPLMARLSDSVAPEVQTISRGSALSNRATSARAASTASSACQPKVWLREAGLPKLPSASRQAFILAATWGSTGVVAE